MRPDKPTHAAGAPGEGRTTLALALALAALTTSLLVAEPAYAHDEGAAARGLASGLLHPITGPDHVTAMVAVGLWGAQLGRPAIWVLPVLFPIVMALGGFAGLIGLPLPAVEIGIALSAIVLGLMVLLEARPPLPVAIAIVSIFAVFHGHAHGTELPEDESGLAYSAGFVISTGLLHAAGIGIGTIHRYARGRFALRVLGAVVLVAGIWFLGGAIS